MNSKQSIETAAEDYAAYEVPAKDPYSYEVNAFKAGALSDAAKEYWFEQFKLLAQKPYSVGDGWIDVKDRLPDESEEVLCFTKFGRIIQNSYQEYTDQNKEWFRDRFSHWQPLPSPPNTEL